MNSEVKQPNGAYVSIPEGSQVLIVRDENEGLATKTDEDKIDLSAYWHTFDKYKWRIFGLTLVIALLTTVWAASLPRIYRSTALLLIEIDKANVISIEEVSGGTSPYRSHRYYETQLKILKSRVLAEKLVDELSLLSHPEFDLDTIQPKFFFNWRDWLPEAWLPPNEEAPPPTQADKRKAIAKVVMADLDARSVRDSQLVEISFESKDPQLAADVPNTLADIYIKSDLEAKLEMTNTAAAWLTERMEGLRENLRESEKKLQDYMRKQNLVNVAGVKSVAAKQIEETASHLVNARQRFTEAENIYKQVQKAVRSGSPNAIESIPAILNHSLIQSLKQVKLDAAKKVSELKERYGQKHPKIIAALAELKLAEDNTTQQIKLVIDGITKEYELAKANVEALERSLEENKRKIREINRKEFQISVLERDVEVNRQLYNLFLTRFKETDASQDIQRLQSTVGRVIEPALVSKIAYKPKKTQIVLISLVLGLLFSTMLAFFVEYLDHTIKNSEDVEEKLGLPLLTSIPSLKIDKKTEFKTEWAFLNTSKPLHGFTESIRTARTGIMLSSLDNPHKILVVTSSVPGEGKTTFSTNQAIALGQMDKTLLIDADMRRPSIGKSLGLNKKAPGLSELVAGTKTVDECTHQAGDIDVIPCGVLPPNPLELLSSSKFGQILEELSHKYGYIVIDSAPTMLVSDAVVLVKYAHVLVYVIKAGATHYRFAREGLKRLRQVKAPVQQHIVLNHLDAKKSSKYYYGKYGYYKGYYKSYYSGYYHDGYSSENS